MQTDHQSISLDHNRRTEIIRTYDAFFRIPATMRMVEVQTGILRPNICRYVARLVREGKIKLIRYGYCPHTKHLAGFYSSDTCRFKHSEVNLQFQLFK